MKIKGLRHRLTRYKSLSILLSRQKKLSFPLLSYIIFPKVQYNTERKTSLNRLFLSFLPYYVQSDNLDSTTAYCMIVFSQPCIYLDLSRVEWTNTFKMKRAPFFAEPVGFYSMLLKLSWGLRWSHMDLFGLPRSRMRPSGLHRAMHSRSS